MQTEHAQVDTPGGAAAQMMEPLEAKQAAGEVGAAERTQAALRRAAKRAGAAEGGAAGAARESLSTGPAEQAAMQWRQKYSSTSPDPGGDLSCW